MSDYRFPREEKKFSEFLVREYLKYGSVNEAFKANRYSLPVSQASYHRVIEKWGIVKAAGPNNKLNEALEFLAYLSEGSHSFDKLYCKMPPSFRTSAVTLYRILSYIKEGITRRIGTALVITSSGNKDKILMGRDISTPRIDLGKPYGSISIPMGFSRKRDSREDAILRVLQQEVFTEHAISQKMPDVIPSRPKPFMFIDIADVRVEVFHIDLPKKYCNTSVFSSFKICDFKFLKIDKIVEGKIKKYEFRVGIKEIATGFQKYCNLVERNLALNPIYLKSSLNYQLAKTPY